MKNERTLAFTLELHHLVAGAVALIPLLSGLILAIAQGLVVMGAMLAPLTVASIVATVLLADVLHDTYRRTIGTQRRIALCSRLGHGAGRERRFWPVFADELKAKTGLDS
ncbi:hypothetical protein [Thioalkalivibrio sp. ALMg11]|uniref:hypothetical protein n=1 Tax=Thioalkalivibrio sp. ALMg11 TaxID=1158165 RepID=UPI000361BFFF|nr:hypothetical protein [Thioalkalivibrio sp. ALMg11]